LEILAKELIELKRGIVIYNGWKKENFKLKVGIFLFLGDELFRREYRGWHKGRFSKI